MRLIVITREEFFEGEAALLTALMDAGLERLHLRKPRASHDEIVALVEALPEQYRSRVVLHDAHEIAERYALGGVHLNSRSPHALSGWQGSVSRSCHTLDELRRYGHSCDYLFLSPIFDSISKHGYTSAFTEEELRLVCRDVKGVVALGGVTLEHMSLVRDMGFDGAAVLGDVWCRPTEDIVKHFERLRDICAEL